MSKLGFNAPPDVTDRNDAVPCFTPGCIVEDTSGKRYKYVQFKRNSVDSVAGYVAFYASADTACKSVTQAIASSAGQNAVAGVFTKSTVTDTYYTFILIEGLATLKTDAGDDIVAGDQLIARAGQNGTVDRMVAGTAPTHRAIGWAVENDNDTNDTVLAYVTLPG